MQLPGCDNSKTNVSGADDVNAVSPWFEECAVERGVVFNHHAGHRQRYLIPEIMAGGAALFDLENDGDLDMYLVQAGSLYPDAIDQPRNRLFRNRGDGHFDDITVGCGADDQGYGMGLAAGDYNNDGLTDLYITNVGPNVLLKNNGDGTFRDVTSQAGVGDDGFGASAAFVDIDADGHLDLFVTNYLLWSMATERECFSPGGQPDYCGPRSYEAPAPDVLYRNNGDGTFSDISAAAGIDQAFGNGLGVVCGDFSGDGLVDIFVANDATPNQLWVNQGRTGESSAPLFVDEAWQRGCAVDDDATPKAGMGVTATDLGDDGLLDVLVVNLGTESDSLHINHGDYFVDATAIAGLGRVSRPYTRFGVAFADFDNDGTPDLFQANGRVERDLGAFSASDPYAEPNLLLRGVDGSRFEAVAPRGGTNPELIATSRAAAFGDIDNDGGVDIVIVNRDGPAHLLRNVTPARGHWIAFRVLDEHGRDALGARVTMQVGGRTITREVRSAYSYLAANDPRVHIGLGDATDVTDVTVRWLNGAIEEFGSFEGSQIVALRRGDVGAAE
jgi:hypothetical protein